MTEFEQLCTLAFRSERVAGRRLSIKESISEEQALKRILQNVAGKTSLLQLLENRQTQTNTNIERLATKRRLKSQERRLKLANNYVSEGTWLAWFDGSARPNPGRCGIGIVLKGPNGEYVEISKDIGHGDSSDAEYCALIKTLEMAIQIKAIPLVVYGDSQVVIDDVGLATNAFSNLVDHRIYAHSLINQLGVVRFCWIPRHKNAEADKLSQRATR